MNDTIKSLISRRSIRKFKPEQIKNEELDIILKAATYAPTGMNRQSPLIVVVQDKETISTLSKLNAEVLGRTDTDPFFGAPTVVIIFSDKTIRTFIEDGSLVMGNLMNAAYSIGIGSCWIHRAREVFETEAGRALMKKWGIPENYQGISHCILGYPDGDYPEARPRKDNYIIKV